MQYTIFHLDEQDDPQYVMEYSNKYLMTSPNPDKAVVFDSLDQAVAIRHFILQFHDPDGPLEICPVGAENAAIIYLLTQQTPICKPNSLTL